MNIATESERIPCQIKGTIASLNVVRTNLIGRIELFDVWKV